MNKDKLLVSAMQGLALDTINKAKGGHSGMALGAAEITETLFTKHLNITNLNPKWVNRDKFLLSAGHGSVSIYTIMHYMGLLTLDDMKNYRNLNSKTPAHPETDAFEYVDASTGSLGQGIAMGVGMAIARDFLANKFNKPDFKLFDHSVYVLHGDGCLQEGIAHEAIQLAGTLQLDKFVLIHDFNKIQLDSEVKMVNNTDLMKYFEAMNFNVFRIDSSTENIDKIFNEIKQINGPTYIQIHTKIAQHTPNEGTVKGHSGVFDEQTTIEIKNKLKLDFTEPFKYDISNYEYAQSFWKNKNLRYGNWNKLVENYNTKYPELSIELDKLLKNKIQYDFSKINYTKANLSTREYTKQILNFIEQNYWSYIGGSADLTSSTNVGFQKDFTLGGHNLRYGIREHAMTAINNGINLTTNLKTFASTFLAFSDYAKGALRMASLMKLPAINIYSHDSYAIGSDGPSHQPIEQITMLRAIPNMKVLRPCDENEITWAFNYAMNQNDHQISIITSRQNLESFSSDINTLNTTNCVRLINTLKGRSTHFLTLLASGSEVMLANKAAKKLNSDLGINVRIFSVPFLQELTEKREIIQKLSIDKYPILAIEASNDCTWYKFAQYTELDVVLASNFGASADAKTVYEMNGFNIQNIVSRALKLLKIS
ncbi:transketolase [Mycoplasma sp. ES3157-GEN-MYC]|uniref:transketolase n=1 Tax=Mycoplasma miroungigenitalium TaxID=754515 RepID=A0A6M4J8B9_9MOLU|nr:transketolase [Mycoplasma miroungigenitalium]MBU4690116.1 transketolase [Mycoplasma miroungigenitalium]MBU4691388.1 transketolase [Mycoplasma miroungigenitalium]QJR43224.1 transketolase [Mycoplasma miroungigenitalium]